MSYLETISARAKAAPESGIVEIINYARGRDNLLPLWAGEGDLPTPGFIREAAKAGLDRGETFYTYQRGIPELRAAIADYYARYFNAALSPEHVYVTGSGMHAIKLMVEALTEVGDEAIYLAPAWPNISAALGVSGAKQVGVPLAFTDGRWTLDLDRLEAAITPKTTMMFINTPSNPTGWTASLAELKALLDVSRRHGIWILADEIYALYHFAGGRAASFLDVMEDGDRVVFVNSFSKNWSMTGWRLGWLVAPPELGDVIENLVQYTTSGVAQFMQSGALAAIRDGDSFITENIRRAREGRDILCDRLLATNRVETLKPDGALYAFLKIDGITGSRRAALDIVDKTGVGLAPGSAFGPGGEPFLRACFLRDGGQLADAAERLADYIGKL
ncbi:pyridoxal phosphate-dependent aminotransferase [Martelella endophytica]|uniref:Aminotransferase n=1 Tax=Martelella endophytica TaxID=1486262 RepID=A0A0D5LK84_MAREN|nr:pyridoxal phosphate-dependent aminotransferase [Martelella endophytica]AJY44556.1 aspartate aminotransferase [Martelella endophytica]